MKTKLFILVFLCKISAAQASPVLWVESNLSDPGLADEAVSIIQCITSAREGTWELVDKIKENQNPALVFSEKDKNLLVSAQNKIEKKSFSANFCPQLMQFFGIEPKNLNLMALSPPPLQQNPKTPDLNFSEETENPGFFKRNWPYFAVGAAVIGGFFAYKHFSQDETPSARGVHVETR